MKHTGVFTAMLLVSVMAGAARAESMDDLSVRIYNSASLPLADLLGAQRAAAPILYEAGLDVSLRYCSGPALPPEIVDRCNDRLEPREVIVRVINAPRFSLSPETFGVAVLPTDVSQARFITLYADRIAVAAARVGLDSGTLLGRVLAHEVGHVLLGSHTHGETGLMRAFWPDEMLNRATAQEWRFSADEAVAMQHRLALVTPETD